MRFFACLFFILFIVNAPFAQTVRFESDCNATEVLVGSTFRVTFRLQNAEIKNIEYPNFSKSGADIVMGPVFEQRHEYINGKSSFYEAYSFTLVARKEGSIKIGPAKVTTTTNKIFKSAPIKIEAIKAKNLPAKEEQSDDLPEKYAGKVFLRIVPSTTNAVVGEQVLVDIKIYTQIDIVNIEMVKELEFKNMFSHMMREYYREPQVEVYNGRQYASKTLRRIAIFPSQSGTIKIDPVIANIGIGGRNQQLNPFARPETYPLKSLPVEIFVKELDGSPSSFVGGVGKYNVQFDCGNSKITTDELLKIKLRIEGLGDVKKILTPPILGAEDAFDIHISNNTDKSKEHEGFWKGYKELEYILTPTALGTHQIRPTFTYFDPEKKKFVSIDTLIEVTVVQGNRVLSDKKSLDTKATAETKENTLAILEPQTKAVWKKSAKPFWGSMPFWFFSMMPFALLGLGFLGRRFWEQKAPELALKRQKNADFAELQQQMIDAQKHLKSGQSAAFYESISKALMGYVGHRLHIPDTLLSRSVVTKALEEKGVESEIIQQTAQIIQKCEMAVFAGIIDTQEMERVYSDSKTLIDQLEKRLA